MRAQTSPTGLVHLIKLAVGVPGLEEFEARVQARRDTGMRVRTRSFPKRADDIVGQGSLYWVVAGLLAARQKVLSIEEGRDDGGIRCAFIHVEPVLIRVSPVRMRPFQGWRYLEPQAAPADLRAGTSDGLEALPPAVLRELRELCLV